MDDFDYHSEFGMSPKLLIVDLKTREARFHSMIGATNIFGLQLSLYCEDNYPKEDSICSHNQV